jgi:uncharacterized delta-60 repeat protein
MFTGRGVVPGWSRRRPASLFLILSALAAGLVAVRAAEPRPGGIHPGFDAGLKQEDVVFDVLPAAGGQFYVAGGFTNIGGLPRTNVARLRADGSADPAFNPGLGPRGGGAYAWTLAPQGTNLIVGGEFQFFDDVAAARLARLSPAGRPDPGFAANNLFGGLGVGISVVATLPDGKILVGGSFPDLAPLTRINLIRLHADGTMDPAFNSGEITGQGVNALVVLPDGKILFGGSRLGRLLPNGAPDTSFGGGAGYIVDASRTDRIAVQADGRILVGGRFRTFAGVPRANLTRLLADGRDDPSFRTPDDVNGTVRALLPLADGCLLVGGDFSLFAGRRFERVVRLRADGAVDPVFRSDVHFVKTAGPPSGAVTAILPAAGGRHFIAGTFTSRAEPPRASLMQIEPGGTNNRPARVLAGPADVTAPVGEDLVLRAEFDGQPYPAFQWTFGGQPLPGATNHLLDVFNLLEPRTGNYALIASNSLGAATSRVARVTALPRPPATPGTLVPEFYPGNGVQPRPPTAESSFYLASLALQADRRLLVAGAFTNYGGGAATGLVRVLPDGMRDPSFLAGGPVTTNAGIFPDVRQVALRPDGALLVGGVFDRFGGHDSPGLARTDRDGRVDTNFTVRGLASTFYVRRFAVQADGALLVAGNFRTTAAPFYNGLARLLPDGRLDPAFRPLAGITNINQSSALVPTTVEAAPGGKALLSGTFTSYLGRHWQGLARLLPDGQPDDTFRPASINTERARQAITLLALPSGGTLVGGSFLNVDGLDLRHLFRLRPDGSRDPGFTPTSLITDVVTHLATLPDGRILVAFGAFAQSGNPRSGVLRLLPDGAADASFTPVATDNAPFAVIADPQGDAYVGGAFLRLNGVTRNQLARIVHEGETGFVTIPMTLRHAAGVSTVRFPSTPGTRYTLEHRDAVQGGAWTAGANVVAGGTQSELTDPAAAPATRIYRLRVN